MKKKMILLFTALALPLLWAIYCAIGASVSVWMLGYPIEECRGTVAGVSLAAALMSAIAIAMISSFLYEEQLQPANDK